MTDAELRDAAWKELTQTGITYSQWAAQGFGAGHWKNAKAYLDQIGLAAPTYFKKDAMTSSDISAWGAFAGKSPSQCTWNSAGFRTITLRQGEVDQYGDERAQLGHNSHVEPTFWNLHDQEERSLTWGMRFPTSFPYSGIGWGYQVVQLKQSQPYSDDGNVGVALEIQVRGGKAVCRRFWQDIFSFTMPAHGTVVNFEIKVRGSAGADGYVEYLMNGATSGKFTGPTLAVEKSTSKPIPSVLMLGIYRDPRNDGDASVDIFPVTVS